MDRPRVVSVHPPYVPITLSVHGQAGILELDALIDTGFDGQVIVPSAVIAETTRPENRLIWRLADRSRVRAPTYSGDLQIGSMRVAPVVVTALGDEPLIGRSITNRFTVTFDHDRQIIVEP